MTSAERKFSDIEAALSRARCLSRVLRHVTDCGHDATDPELWGGVYIIAGDIETALDEAATCWTAAHKLAAGGSTS